ncbi:unnamed protein product [Adineta ricciae]|uniref:LIM zinc-binding domain-containing protein n=1 Tax=Adineta ricciae TaxID=249248 RepID=A0A813UZA1_ADIRI|nr:unnamed protein product [Adineta ricciae]
MERRRLQHRRMKQQKRICTSQPDLTKDDHHQQHHQSLMDLSSTLETSINRSVSELINEFETRALNTSSSSYTQKQLPMVNDIVYRKVESNSRHMSIRTMNIKDGNNNDSDSINNSVCSSISHVINADNSRVTFGIQRHQHTDGDKEREKGERVIHQTLNNDRHKQNLPLLSICTIENKNNNHQYPRQMLTRSTDIDEAALTLGKRHDIRFHDLIIKEAQLNTALADLFSLSNDADESSSINSSLKSTTLTNDDPRRRSNNKTSTISDSIDLLNNLLETLDSDHETFTPKNKATKEIKTDDKCPLKPINMFCLMLSDNICANCHQSFATNEQIVNAAGQIWHTHCFVCTQCFQPFENGIYFEHEDRKYCERDFQMLFAPCCAECKQAIVGRVIRAIQKCFHPDCFRCQSCQIPLIEMGFSKYNGKALCRECHTKEKTKDLSISQHICSKCHQFIDNNCLKYKDEFYHSYHFQCTTCQIQLDENGREVRGLLYCLPCHNKLDVPVCAACRRLIDDRVISALGKQWHVEHFCCARCGQPFYGSKHFENKGLPYCEADYHFLFGSSCFICNTLLTDGGK